MPAFLQSYEWGGQRGHATLRPHTAELLKLWVLAQVEKAPLESYADVGGLEQQIVEIKEAVELPLTHPELYEDIGIKPPKVQAIGSADTSGLQSSWTMADTWQRHQSRPSRLCLCALAIRSTCM